MGLFFSKPKVNLDQAVEVEEEVHKDKYYLVQKKYLVMIVNFCLLEGQ